MTVCAGIGAGVGAYLLWAIVADPYVAAISGGHIVYASEYQKPISIAVAYLAATTLPLLLSSQRTVVVLGVIILAGSVVAFVFYWAAFASVWCYFAAAASVVILGHFEWSRRNRLGTAAA